MNLYVDWFLLPHDSIASTNPYYSTLEAKKGTQVWGLTTGTGLWFRHCWLSIDRAYSCLAAWKATGSTQLSLDVICTDNTYCILTA